MSNNKQQPKPENPNNQFSNTEPLTHAQRVAIANTMINNKQSSVEWLHHEFERIDKEFHVGTYEYNDAKNLAFKISKSMHKEEILEAYKTGWEECINSKYLPATYYEKTYNNQQ